MFSNHCCWNSYNNQQTQTVDLNHMQKLKSAKIALNTSYCLLDAICFITLYPACLPFLCLLEQHMAFLIFIMGLTANLLRHI